MPTIPTTPEGLNGEYIEGYIDPNKALTIESLISPIGREGRERAKWNTPKSKGGYNADGFEPFPMMLYMAQELPNGQLAVACTQDSMFKTEEGNTITGGAERFTRSCQLIVKDESQLARYLEAGWRKTQSEAVERAHAKRREISHATAERHASDARMSEKAQAEAKAVDRAEFHHVPEIPEKPKRKYVRKAKAVPA